MGRVLPFHAPPRAVSLGNNRESSAPCMAAWRLFLVTHEGLAAFPWPDSRGWEEHHKKLGGEDLPPPFFPSIQTFEPSGASPHPCPLPSIGVLELPAPTLIPGERDERHPGPN